MLSCIINLLVPRRSFLPVGAVVATLALAWVYCWWRWHKQLPRAMAVAERADRLQDYREKQEAQAKVLEAFRMIIRYGADIGDLYLPGQLPTDTKYAYLAVPPSLVPDDLLTDS